eukprot:2336248-Prymnesium_polylepis.1
MALAEPGPSRRTGARRNGVAAHLCRRPAAAVLCRAARACSRVAVRAATRLCARNTPRRRLWRRSSAPSLASAAASGRPARRSTAWACAPRTTGSSASASAGTAP